VLWPDVFSIVLFLFFGRSGFRYELYCVSKAARTTQCTIYAESFKRVDSQTDITSRVEDLDEEEEEIPGYDPDVVAMLKQRYEVPDGKNRWDSPLFRFDASCHDGDVKVEVDTKCFILFLFIFCYST
jgi:protein KTI12